MITVFTPTYNRKEKLKRLYKSLLEQEYKDFEWVIVDDGSTDNTEEVVKEFIKEDLIRINYFKQENQGKSLAHNKGVELAKGDYFVGIDSDCFFTRDALAIVSKYAEKIKDRNDICGLGFLNYKMNTTEFIGTKFPQDEFEETYYNIYNKYKITGDKELTFKTSVIAEFPFPKIENEKFVPESLIFNRISKKYKFLFINKAIINVDYSDEGYSNNYFELMKKNPRANMLYYKELYEFNNSLYNVAAYDMYGIYSKNGFINTIKEHPSKIKALIMYLPAYIKYLQKK